MHVYLLIYVLKLFAICVKEFKLNYVQVFVDISNTSFLCFLFICFGKDELQVCVLILVRLLLQVIVNCLRTLWCLGTFFFLSILGQKVNTQK